MKNLNIFSLITEYDNAKSGGVLNVPNVSFVNEDNSVKYLLELNFYNGYEYVDLGLPSGLKWATCNVGADSPEQAGLYFAWGETTGYRVIGGISNERVFNDVNYTGPLEQNNKNLTLEQDAAHVHMGGKWRMPTKDEFRELINNCDVTFMKNNCIFTSKINGKSISFYKNGYVNNKNLWKEALVTGSQMRGCYWASNQPNYFPQSYLMTITDKNAETSNYNRYCGMSVRGVFE